MEPREGTQSARKHKAIVEAATVLFLSKGYQDTSVDEIAAVAEVGKQTVYKHFADKQHLFSEIILGNIATAEAFTSTFGVPSPRLGLRAIAAAQLAVDLTRLWRSRSLKAVVQRLLKMPSPARLITIAAQRGKFVPSLFFSEPAQRSVTELLVCSTELSAWSLPRQ